MRDDWHFEKCILKSINKSKIIAFDIWRRVQLLQCQNNLDHDHDRVVALFEVQRRSVKKINLVLSNHFARDKFEQFLNVSKSHDVIVELFNLYQAHDHASKLTIVGAQVIFVISSFEFECFQKLTRVNLLINIEFDIFFSLSRIISINFLLIILT